MTDDEMPRAKTVSDEELLAAFGSTPGPVETAPDISNLLPLTRDGVRKRLNKLVDDGQLEKRTVGANAVVYWIPGEVTKDDLCRKS